MENMLKEGFPLRKKDWDKGVYIKLSYKDNKIHKYFMGLIIEEDIKITNAFFGKKNDWEVFCDIGMDFMLFKFTEVISCIFNYSVTAVSKEGNDVIKNIGGRIAKEDGTPIELNEEFFNREWFIIWE